MRASRPARAHPARERRAADRPRNGDTRPCPRCRVGRIEFNERYRGEGGFAPAWHCDNASCGLLHFLRGNPLPNAEGLIRASKKVVAGARRTAMKSRARVARLGRRGSPSR